MTADAARRLSQWFAQNARDLPWRRTHDPYHTLLVEFVLQQTRVETGARYFQRLRSRFPTIHDLAQASEEEVLALWSGLGYYRRARNLHRTAQTIVAHHEGRVPSDPVVLETLPGIGPYTAGAIASIAYDRPVPAIDGNQTRVIARVLGLRDPAGRAAAERIRTWAHELLQHGSPRVLNQALMDLGSLICVPREPRCGVCPWASACRSRDKAPGAPSSRRVPKRVEDWVAWLHVRGDRLWLARPRAAGLLANVWLPPLSRAQGPSRRAHLVHAFSHKTWRIRFVRTRRAPTGHGRWLTRDELATLPRAALTQRAVDRAWPKRKPGRPPRATTVRASSKAAS